MYCNQCQEAAKNIACTVNGVCGKKEDVANIQDLLIYSCQGLSYYTIEARKHSIDTNLESKHIINCLFSTITNANFDQASLISDIKKSFALRDSLKSKVKINETHDSASWNVTTDSDLIEKSKHIGIVNYDADEDIRSLKQYVLFGLKGIAAYVEHAFNLGFEQQDIYDFVEESLVMITRPADLNKMLDHLLRTGEYGVKAMALLDEANTTTYGNPEISNVNIGVV